MTEHVPSLQIHIFWMLCFTVKTDNTLNSLIMHLFCWATVVGPQGIPDLIQ